MKHLFIFLLLIMVSCNTTTDKAEEETPVQDISINLEEELASLEETRAKFQLAIKEGRFEDLRNYGIDVKAYDSDCGPWAEFKALRKNPKGEFSYDSLVMRPRETVIASDSIAYDFGSSSTYYTNESGEPVEITATYLAILKKDKKDGVWKLHREVANTRESE